MDVVCVYYRPQSTIGDRLFLAVHSLLDTIQPGIEFQEVCRELIEAPFSVCTCRMIAV